jgi:hypothetical protein
MSYNAEYTVQYQLFTLYDHGVSGSCDCSALRDSITLYVATSVEIKIQNVKYGFH